MLVLDLFSGIGGFSLGLEAVGFKTAAFCEFDKEARKVLKKNWPEVPIFEDIRTLNKEVLDEKGITDIGLICGGYPCQPFSLAGERRGAEDDRHLWPEMFRIIQELRPTWVIGENVAGHINMGLDEVLTDLESASYTARPFVIPACAVDASHRRDRVWTIAHANSNSQSDGTEHEEQMVAYTNGAFSEGGSGSSRIHKEYSHFDGRSKHENVAHPYGQRQQRLGAHGNAKDTEAQRKGQADDAGNDSQRPIWKAEPNVGRVADGVPRRSHRLRQLGNAVVPQVVEQIGRAIKQVEQREKHDC